MSVLTHIFKKNRPVHVGIIRVSEDFLLDWLQFEDGRLRNIRTDGNGIVELLVEHPDMPEVTIGEPAPEICPGYRAEFGTNGKLLSIERVKT